MITFDNIKEVMSMDPFDIKKSLVDLVDKNLGIGNNDLYEAGFLGYFIQAQTLLTSDILFNNAMAWNEAFTHLLTLPTSLQNHALMFDYELSTSIPCEGNITVYIPFPDNGNEFYQLILKNGTLCDGDIPYIVKNTYLITVGTNGSKVQKRDYKNGQLTDVNIYIQIREGIQYLIFEVEVWQIRIFEFNEDIQNVIYGQYYDINIGGIEDQLYDINIGANLNDSTLNTIKTISYKKVNSIYSCDSKTLGFVFKWYGNGMGTIRFGNGIYGKQPDEGSNIDILVFTTKGKDGIVYPGQIQLNSSLPDILTGSDVPIVGTNLLVINNGVDEENIEVAKNNIIAQISSARRLVSKDDYSKFENIIRLNDNFELYPMLMRRDYNINEIDLFTLLYDQNGMPIPTTNINYIINNNRNFLSRKYIYKIAIKYGDKGVELVPNTLKIINENAIDSNSQELYSAIYIDSDFDNYNEIYELYNHKIIYNYSNGEIEYIDPDEIKEFICPFSINIENKFNNKIGSFEYIPNTINNLPNLEYMSDYSNIYINVQQSVFYFLPEESVRSENIKTTHINIINDLYITDNINNDLFTSYVFISQEDTDYESKIYNCDIQYTNISLNQMTTSCMIPIVEIPKGEFLITYIIYYNGKFYNSYKKYVSFVDDVDLSLIDTYIKIPIKYSYDSNDTRIIPTMPSIDNVYFSINNVSINLDSWKDDNDNNIDGYTIKVQINKGEYTNINKIDCLFILGKGLMQYKYDSFNTESNESVINYIFKVPYNTVYIVNGYTYYQIKLLYKFNDNFGNEELEYTEFSTYSGNIILRKKYNDLMWCNVEIINENNDEKYKIYRIPVIEKQFYNENKDYLEKFIFSTLLEVDNSLINYKMLTDKVNLKFAKTIGITENLKYNDNILNIDESLIYNTWVCDLPPTIELSIIVNRYTNKNIQDIINECKQVIISFLQLKADFNASIIKSELVRYIHDVIPDIISCTVEKPERDIIYMYTENELSKNKDLVLSYTPEFIWIDANKIIVNAILAPM